MPAKPSLPFDRVAERYDQTRGGDARGTAFGDQVAPWLVEGDVLEVGVGTGLVAAALRRRGRSVIGVDLSPAMLGRARERLGARVAVGDALALPVAGAAVPNVVFATSLHVIGDTAGALREGRRVLRPRGRVVAIYHGPDERVTDIDDVLAALPQARTDDPDTVLAAAASVGLAELHTGTFLVERVGASPSEVVAGLEGRLWSNLWEMDEVTWDRIVVPALAALRELPDQDRIRHRPMRMRVSAFTG